jgi:hypothetical protein
MYPYHNKIKQRIKNGELIKFEFVAKYKNISPCLLLYFKTEPYVKPIREHRFSEYKIILDKLDPDQRYDSI